MSDIPKTLRAVIDKSDTERWRKAEYYIALKDGTVRKVTGSVKRVDGMLIGVRRSDEYKELFVADAVMTGTLLLSDYKKKDLVEAVEGIGWRDKYNKARDKLQEFQTEFFERVFAAEKKEDDMVYTEVFETIDEAFDRIELLEKMTDEWGIVSVSPSPTAKDGQYYITWSDKK